MKKLFKLVIFLLVVILIIQAVPFCIDYLFPIKYRAYVEFYAEEYGVDKNLIYAIIKAESNFQSDVVSKKGAKGLMQIMDTTGQWCSKEIGVSEIDLTDVKSNINAGTFYFAHLMKMYGGDEKVAIAAYNAGHGNVDKWLSDTEFSADGKTLDKIPFEETDKYVKKVMFYKKIYSFKEKRLSIK